MMEEGKETIPRPSLVCTREGGKDAPERLNPTSKAPLNHLKNYLFTSC